MLRFALVLLASASLVSATAPHDASWPRWRGARVDGTVTTGTNIFSAPFELRVRWKRTLGAGYSGVVVDSGHAVTMFSDGTTDYLVSLSSRTGDEEWRLPLGPAFPGRDGSAGGPVSTPAIADGIVYALGPRGHLVAVALATGKAVWKEQIAERLGAPTPHWGFTTSPLVTQGMVIVLTGGTAENAITAFDARSGAVKWRRGSDGASYQSPMLARIAGTERLVVGGDKILFALDPRDGGEVWKYEHGGRGFYGQIINPVAMADDRLLLTYRPDESVLLKTSPQPEVAWTTRELKLNYSTPVVHEGKVFGYSGGFLSCVDASTGALLWRSRPPGDGFPIIVDGHVVVMTKQGTLTVAPASGSGFTAKASLELFSRLTWTPPAFAEGAIFARDSYAEIAAVNVVPASRTTEAAPAGAAPAADGESHVRQLLAEHTTFPIVDNERHVHFVYEGTASDVVVRGDFLELGKDLPMTRLGDASVYYASAELAPDARIAYQFVRNLDEAIADPKNPDAGQSLNYVGPTSMLFMPRADRAVPTKAGGGLRGTVVPLEIDSKTLTAEHLRWGGKRKIDVYLPPGYDASQQRYGVVYMFYGEEMRRDGHVDAAIDREIDVTLRPAIVVYIQSTSAYEYARTFREPHRRMIVEEVVPLVDGKFRTMAQASGRTLVGADEAGFAAVEIGLLHPAVFGRIVAHSIYPLSKGDAELLALVDRTPASSQRFYLDWGRYDPRRKADLLDIAGFTERLRDRLRARGYRVEGREYPDGSAVPFWSARAVQALRILQKEDN
jgi:outer membrane protein assembly factor BamB/enterochelin esterase-like enzyme